MTAVLDVDVDEVTAGRDERRPAGTSDGRRGWAVAGRDGHGRRGLTCRDGHGRRGGRQGQARKARPDLAVGPRADGVHGARLEVHEHGAGDEAAAGGLVVVDVDALELPVGTEASGGGRQGRGVVRAPLAGTGRRVYAAGQPLTGTGRYEVRSDRLGLGRGTA